MNKINRVRTTFVRQLSENDCGIACLAMVLNYTGRPDDAAVIRENSIAPEQGVSLLELRGLAAGLKLSSRCVQMDIQVLRECTTPCILHMLNDNGENHFQVFYGARKGGRGYQYLMADPARQVYYLRESVLDAQWKSRAALYFDDLPASPKQVSGSSWGSLLSIKSFPGGLWVSIPFLNICTAFLGIAISWVLQKGINDSLADKKDSLIIAILILLLFVTLAKSLFSYVRQIILININSKVNEQLTMHFILKIVHGSAFNNTKQDHRFIRNGLAEIQKIQSAVSVFMATLLSDGSLILLVLAGVFYAMPVAGLINSVYIGIVCLLTLRILPALSFDYAHLNELSGTTEKYLAKESLLRNEDEFNTVREKRAMYHQLNHRRYLSFAGTIAAKISKMNLIYECLGTMNVIMVFIIGLIKLQQQAVSYGSFMVLVILSYFITALIPKICNALYIIAEGAEAAVKYKARAPGDHNLSGNFLTKYNQQL